MRKTELIILGVILLLALGAWLFLGRSSDNADLVVEITVDGELYQRIPLTNDTALELTVTTDQGYNHVVIADGEVDVDSADCQNQVCVNTKNAHAPHDTIVCLPHRMIIEIVEVN